MRSFFTGAAVDPCSDLLGDAQAASPWLGIFGSGVDKAVQGAGMGRRGAGTRGVFGGVHGEFSSRKMQQLRN